MRLIREKAFLCICLATTLLLSIVTGVTVASPETRIYVSPPRVVDTTGTMTTLAVDIKIESPPGPEDAINCWSYQIKLRWNGPILQAPAWLLEPTGTEAFFPPSPAAFFGYIGYNGPDPVGEPDWFIVTNTLVAGEPPLWPHPWGINGSGILATIEFTIEGSGESGLQLFEPLFISYEGEEIPVTLEHGYFSNELWDGEGDVDGDGDVDIADLVYIAHAMGTDPNWPWGTDWGEWNPDADLNGDLKVNIFDLFMAATNYGQPYV